MRRQFTLIELLMVITIIALVALISISGVAAARKSANEGSAIASLKIIITQQTLFRESDPDTDNNPDYASLSELSDHNLIDPILGAGTKSGYRFQAAVSTVAPDTFWYAVANPALAERTGDKYFATNQAGVIFFTWSDAFGLNTTNAAIPTTAIPIK